MQRQQCVSELIRLLSKDTGGSRHYTGWGKNTIANHSRKMLGLQSKGRGGRQKVQEREREDRTGRRHFRMKSWLSCMSSLWVSHWD